MVTRTEERPVRVISAQVPADMAEALRERATDEERSMSGTIRVALRAYLESDDDERSAS